MRIYEDHLDSFLSESIGLKLESGETPYMRLKGDSEKLDRVAVSAKRIIGCMAKDLVVCDSSSPNFHKFTENFDGHPLKIVGVTDEDGDYKTLVFAGTINRVPVLRLTMDEEGAEGEDYIHYDYFVFKGIDKAQMLGISKKESMVFDKEKAVESINASMSAFFALDTTAKKFRVDTIHSASFDPIEESLTVEVTRTYEDGESKHSSLKLKDFHDGKYRIEGFSPTEGNALVEGNSIIFRKDNLKGDIPAISHRRNNKMESIRHYDFDEKLLSEQINETLTSIFGEPQFRQFMPFVVESITEAYFSASDDSLVLETSIVYEDGDKGTARFMLSDIHTGTYMLTETTGVFDLEEVVIKGNCSIEDGKIVFGEEE